MALNEALSIRIDELLAEKGITQYRLAIKSGLSSEAISKIRLQKNKMCAINIIYEIAQGFDMTLEEFFSGPLFSKENITD